MPKNGGLGQFADLKGGLARKMGGVFLRGWGVDTLMPIMAQYLEMHSLNRPNFGKAKLPNLWMKL